MVMKTVNAMDIVNNSHQKSGFDLSFSILTIFSDLFINNNNNNNNTTAKIDINI